MAVLQSPKVAPFGAVTVLRLVSAIEAVFQPLVRWNKARRIDYSLSRLSARQLDDIGLTRGDITRIASDLSRR